MDNFRILYRGIVLAYVLAAVLGLSGCGDDDPVEPEAFKITLKVVDPGGDPVPGLEIGMMNYWAELMQIKNRQDKGWPDKGLVHCAWVVERPADVLVLVEDIEGRVVRTLFDQYCDLQGSYYCQWNGESDEEVHLPSGRYTVHLIAREPGGAQIIFEDSKDMFMALTYRYLHGPTDDTGLIVLRDKKLFPQFYERENMVATDELGEPLALLSPLFSETTEMYFYVYDPVSQESQSYVEHVTGPGQVVTLVWDPDEVLKSSSSPTSRQSLPVTYEPSDKSKLGEWRLDLPYPNPFN